MKKVILLMVLASLFLVGIVNATISTPTLAIPATGGTLGTNGLVNITLTNTSECSIIWCVVQVMSASTANSSWTTIVNITNTSYTNVTDGKLNGTIGSTVRIEPSNDYSMRAVCWNSSDSAATGSSSTSATVTNVVVDRADIPVRPTTSHADDTEFDYSILPTITYTVVGTNTTGCRIAFLDDGATPRFTGSNTFAMTHSGNSCTYTILAASIPNRVYDVYVQASDGTNTSYSAKSTFKITSMSEGGAVEDDVSVGVATEVAQKKRLQQVGILFVLFILGYVIFFKKDDKK